MLALAAASAACLPIAVMECRVRKPQRNDRIVPDWLGWLAIAVALILAALLAYFEFS